MAFDLDQARRQAKELLRAANRGDADALARLRSDRSPRLADAQTAVARSLGHASWPAMVVAALGDAVRGGDAPRLRALLDGGASVRGSDLLLHARDPAITALLLEHGARVDVRDAHGLTPYSRAARFKSEENLRLLADAGGAGDLDPAAEWVGAVVRGDLERAERVTRAHPDLQLRWDDREQLPRWASAGDDAVVARLLDAGLPVDARGAFEGTALHYAGLWGRASTLRLLLARGADAKLRAEPPDRPGQPEWTALDWTAWGSVDAVQAPARRPGYRDCAAVLLAASTPLTGRAEAAHLVDEIRETGGEYQPGRPIRIRIRLRGTRAYVEDMGGAVAVAGAPPGWQEPAARAVAQLGWNIRRNGVVCMQTPAHRRLEWVIERTAAVSAAVCDAILEHERTA